MYYNFGLMLIALNLFFCFESYSQSSIEAMKDDPRTESQSNIQNRIELKIGYEPVRNIPGSGIGYKISANEYLSFLPELSFMCGINLSLSLKPQISINNQIILYSSVGMGLDLLIGKNWFTALGSEIKLNHSLSFMTEFRIIFFSNNNESRTTSIAGYDLVKQRPMFLSVGISI